MTVHAMSRTAWFGAMLLLAAAGAAQGPVLRTPATDPKPTPTLHTPEAGSDKPSTTTLNVDARLVNIPVVVHDKKGALVENLTKDSFVLQVDNRPQTIRYFNIDKDLPLT